MEKLLEIWPWIERYGPPLLGLALLVTTWLLSIYWRSLAELRRRARHLHRWGNDLHFEPRSLPWVGLRDFLQGFLPPSRLDAILQTTAKGRAELAELRSLRRLLRWWLPLWLGLALLGVLLNEWLDGRGVF